MNKKIKALVMPPIGEDALGIALNLGDNIHKRYVSKRNGRWTVWTPRTKSGRYVWLEVFTSEELITALSKSSNNQISVI